MTDAARVLLSFEAGPDGRESVKEKRHVPFGCSPTVDSAMDIDTLDKMGYINV